jgi:hypothetical protein
MGNIPIRDCMSPPEEAAAGAVWAKAEEINTGYSTNENSLKKA